MLLCYQNYSAQEKHNIVKTQQTQQ